MPATQTATSVKPFMFIGHRCSIGKCLSTADYLVVDGHVPVPTCSRHLVDAVESEVEYQALTVDCDALEVYRLREDEND